MSRIVARFARVSFGHAGGAQLFSNLDLDLFRGILAVTGENGAGKSTLLDLLDGSLTPDAGMIRRPELIARTSQDVDEAPVDDVDPAIAARLKLDVDVLSRWPVASPGERRRWQVAAAFSRNADLLLLDEPTNHLDDAARSTVIDMLRRSSAAIVIVTHDRALVTELAHRTMLLHRGRALVVEGGWDEAWSAHETMRRADDERRAQARETALSARVALADARRRAGASEAQRSARTRMKNIHDHDATGLMAQFRADKAAARHGRDVARLRGEAERAHEEWAAEHAKQERVFGANLAFEAAPLAKPWLARVDGTVLKRDVRLRIAGANGAGKTTLLKRIRDASGLDGNALFFLPQDLGTEGEEHALRAFHALSRDERGRVGELLAALGVDPARLASSARPSAGEAKKLLIARALAFSAQALLLDEPTNHLDLPSVERLATALAKYRGALVVVTHDERFAKAAGISETIMPMS